MRIELRTWPGCPNAEPARRLVSECVARLGLDVSIIDRVGHYASPTVLVDGVDVMGADDAPPAGDTCRLDPPTADRVLAALRAATGESGSESTTVTDQPATAAPASVAATVGSLSRPMHALHRQVLRGFVDVGRVHRDYLAPVAAELGVDLDDALRRLADIDLVHTAADGYVETAYPFSDHPTGHTVQLVGRPAVAAMCAIDALGVPLMTGLDGLVTSADPDVGTPVRIQRRGELWSWQPATTVVVVACTDRAATLATRLCRSVTFHADPEHAHRHLRNHRELHGIVVDQATAIDLARYTFGAMLTD